MNEEKYNILLSPSVNLYVQTLTLMRSIMQNCSRPVTFYILTSDWSDDVKQSCQRFVNSLTPANVFFIEIDEKIFHILNPWRGFYQCYYMLDASRLLPDNIERILYLDIDTMVLGDIDLLYSMDFNGCYFIAADENCKRKRSDFAALIEKHKQPALFNSGVLLMNIPALRKSKIDINYFLERIKEMPDGKYFADQGLLNFCFWDRTKYVPAYNWNHTTYQEQSFDEMLSCADRIESPFNEAYSEAEYEIRNVGVKIVHFTVSDKPWDVYINPSGEVFGKLVPAEAKPLIVPYYESWWAFARELPLELYENLLFNAFERKRVRCEKRIVALNKALDFICQLADDLAGERKFVGNIMMIKDKGLRTAVLKSNDIAGKLLLKFLKNFSVEVVFSTAKNNADRLTAAELEACSNADLVVSADVHTHSCPSFDGKKSINICILLKSANAIEMLYKDQGEG